MVTAVAVPPVADIVTVSTASGCVVLPPLSLRVTAKDALPDTAVDCEAGVSVMDVGRPVVVNAQETVSSATPALKVVSVPE